MFGHRDHSERVGTLSFRSEALPATELGGILDQAFDIAVRPGLHCTVHSSALGTFPDGACASVPDRSTRAEDIDVLLGALRVAL